MGAPLERVLEVLDMLKEDGAFANEKIPVSFCKFGVIQASISLGKDFPISTTTVTDTDGNDKDVIEIGGNISDKEVYLAGIYAYRNYAMKTHDEMAKKAINFKTISFAITGMTERAKEIMRIVWWCENEIKTILAGVRPSAGVATEMVGE